MGLKQILIVLLIFNCTLQAQSQSTITHFEVDVIWDGLTDQVSVVEAIQFSDNPSISQITLQSLNLKKATIQHLSIKLNDNSVDASLERSENGLLEASVESNKLVKMEISYQANIHSEEILVPLIFLPLNSLSTDENLFSATLTIPASYKLIESFPTINNDEVVEADMRIYDVQLPVIPSLIKMNLAPKDKFQLGKTEMLDVFVLVVLIILGVVGWKNRKMLA